MDNQYTKLEDRLKAAKPYILLDMKIYKRLRYTYALMKIGKEVTEKQATMLVTDMMLYLERQGVSIEDTQDENEKIFQDFYMNLLKEAWNSGDFLSNAKVLKTAIENAK